MRTDIRNDLQTILREEVKNKNVNLPKNIGFYSNGYDVEIILTKEAAGFIKSKYVNMQENSACFEGWAIAIKTYCLNEKTKFREIVLKVEGEDSGLCFPNGINGHLGRFLYRALRFSQQYKEWFELSKPLQDACNYFEKRYLINPQVKLVNNIAAKDAGDRGGESHIENLLSENCCLNRVLNSNSKYKTYRQLPVGLFMNKVEKGNVVFTGGKSAIDLWLYDDTTRSLNVVELKFFNKMVGIITEIFFYSNYIYDMLLRKNCSFSLNDEEKGDDRGYGTLRVIKEQNICDKIIGVMLNDKTSGYHPLVSDEVVKTLNTNNMNSKLIYERCEYDFITEIVLIK